MGFYDNCNNVCYVVSLATNALHKVTVFSYIQTPVLELFMRENIIEFSSV